MNPEITTLPLVSVTLFVKDAVYSIRRAVESVLSQDYPHVELVIQDGVSTDGTLEILRSYGDKISLVSEPDNSPMDAHFRSIRRAKGEILACCLADEEMMPGAISWGVRNLLQNPHVAAIYGDHYCSDLDGNILCEEKAAPWDLQKYMCCEIVPPYCSSFMRTSCFRAAGISERTDCGEYEIWLRLGMKYPIQYIPGFPVSKFGVHAGSKTRQKGSYHQILPGRIQVLTEILKQQASEVARKLLPEAVAGNYLWCADTFLTLEAYEDCRQMLEGALRYHPSRERLQKLMKRLRRQGIKLGNKASTGPAQMCFDMVEQIEERVASRDDTSQTNRGQMQEKPAAQCRNSQMPQLTLFTVPKAFRNNIAIIQTNALVSWTQLVPRPDIIILGNDPGCAEIAKKLSLRHIPHIPRNEHGTPLLPGIFQTPQQASTHPLFAYVNADIILMQDFIEALDCTYKAFEQFLMIGQRWDIDISSILDFQNPSWSQQLKERLAGQAERMAEDGIDYFTFSRGVYDDILPFALGRTAWDNWLVYKAIEVGAAVINATDVITAVHQNHDYNHLPGGKNEAWKGIEAKRNQTLAGKDTIRTIGDARYRLTRQGIEDQVKVRMKEASESIRQRDYNAALRAYLKALKSDPRNGHIRDNISKLYHAVGLREQAQRIMNPARHPAYS